VTLPALILGLGAATQWLNLAGFQGRMAAWLFRNWQTLDPDGALGLRLAEAKAWECAAQILAGTATIFLITRLRLHWAALFLVIALAGFFQASWYLFLIRHWLIDAATPAIFLGAAFLVGTAARLVELHLLRTRLRIAFSDSLPLTIVEQIARRPEILSIEGETRTITFLVCGVRRLAGLAAEFRDDPKGFTHLMSEALTPLMDQALAHGGTIDRLTADGFAAFWNAPLDDPGHALHACEAANAIAAMAARVNEHITAMKAPTGNPLAPLEMGIGIATGPVIAGGFGGLGRLGYSVNGEAVQLASRIQALSPQYGPAVIVSEETRQAAERAFAFLEVDYIAAGEGDPPVKLFALLGTPVARTSPKFKALATFHDHIFKALRSQQWGKARELIEQCRKLSGASQALYDLHLSRIAYYEKNPPGAEWDGAFRPVLK